MEILDSPNLSQQKLAYAGFWIRVAAFLIDMILVYFAIFLVGGVASVFVVSGDLSLEENPMALVGFMLMYVVMLGAIVSYFALMESSDKQATLGKMAVGIKVGKANGEKISFLNAVGRYFAKALSGLILYIGYIMVAFDTKNQGLHDKLANTYVFYSNKYRAD